MGFIQRPWGSKKEEAAPSNTDVTPVAEDEAFANDEKTSSSDEGFGAKQPGVLKVEAAAQAWTKSHLIGAYVMYDS